ncbi:MAG: AAA family ATPase [Candidatus Dojkabacteria bacterium]|nr:MAG: AAA family ATPase [Candidatus Dojkabacteria bacterium]
MADISYLESQSETYSDITELLEKLEASHVPTELKEEGKKMIVRVYRMAKKGSYSSEFENVSRYVDWVLSIPWEVYSTDSLDLARIREELDKYHFGLDKVKERILAYMAVMKLKQDRQVTGGETSEVKGMTTTYLRPPVLCFVGLQGLGKTTIAKSIANSLGRKYVRISLAAFGSIAQLRGSARSNPDAEPGLIIQAIRQAGTLNPVIVLDEIDKASGIESLRNDIMAALLEILDPAQNESFVDRFINYPVDLSKCFFITTANTLGTLSAALLDRLEIIRFTSYSDDEKITIAKSYVMPRVIAETGLTENQLQIADEAWPLIVRPMGYDAGIRQLERTMNNLARRVAYQLITGETTFVRVTPENVKRYLPEDLGVMG